MKLLCSSSDLGELEWLVKRLMVLRIPCGVGKDPGESHLSVWIQQDSDFALGLRILVNRDKPRPLPSWACLLDSPVPANEESAVAASGEYACREWCSSNG